MAAFCACCGAEITRKPEACPKCGAPRHGSSPLDRSQNSVEAVGPPKLSH
jgi:predicted amidophosphoribosyltransferase